MQHSAQKIEPLSDNEDSDRSGGQGDIQPVGHDYVEEVSNEPEEHVYYYLVLTASYCI